MVAAPQALIVEDEVGVAAVFALALQAAGFDPEIAYDGGSAVSWLADHQPQLVVLDLHLPNVSGAVILNQIRSDARLASTRIIVTSADARGSAELRNKVDAVIDKPVSFRQLRDLASRFLKN